MLEAILFDLDGVIIDSRSTTIRYFKETLTHFNLPIPNNERFEKVLALKTLDITRGLVENVPEEKIMEIYNYSKTLSVKYAPTIQLIPHIKTVLTTLSKKYKLGLITSRGKNTTRILFKIHNLSKFFPVVIDREDVSTHKPNPEGILKCLDILHITPRKAVYVGDHEEDVIAAKNAHVLSILLTNAQNKDADYCISKITTLPKILEKL